MKAVEVPRRRHRRLGILLLSTAVALTLFSAPPAEAGRPGRMPERQMKGQVNEARLRHNTDRLFMRRKLVRIARRHSRAMASSGTLFHSSNLGDKVPNGWRIVGENVGVGYSIESLHEAFMASAPHRRNNLRPAYEKIGVGVVQRDGRIWITVVFYG
jgi:uncharacterized protein YkwD